MRTRSTRKRKKLWMINGILFLLTISCIIFLFIFLNQDHESKQQAELNALEQAKKDEQVLITPTSSPTPEPTSTPPPYTDAVWIGVGDVMSHTPQLPGAYNKSTDSYDFNSVFEPISQIVSEGDWVMANLETPIAGKDYGYTGYPTFNAPVELAEALWNNGFNILSTANNHTIDKGVNGAIRTLDHVQALGFITVGSYRDQEEQQKKVIVEHNDVAMGILAYSYGTNGIPIPEGKEFIINLIDEAKIKKDIQEIREAGADVVTIALHFGNEYQTTASDSQKTLARSLIAAGADIIAGSHPHVLQPYELVTSVTEDGKERQGLIIYSMGNFISNQRGDSKDYGGIFRVDLRKHTDTGMVEIREVTVTPTWVHRYKPDEHYRYRVLPVAETLEARSDELLKPSDYNQLEADLAMLNKRLESMLEQ